MRTTGHPFAADLAPLTLAELDVLEAHLKLAWAEQIAVYGAVRSSYEEAAGLSGDCHAAHPAALDREYPRKPVRP